MREQTTVGSKVVSELGEKMTPTQKPLHMSNWNSAEEKGLFPQRIFEEKKKNTETDMKIM